MCQHPSRGLGISDYSLSKLGAHHPHPGQDVSHYKAHIEQQKLRKHHPWRAEMKILEKLHYRPLRQIRKPFLRTTFLQRICRVQFADVRRNKAHTGCKEESNGSRTLFPAINLSQFFIARGVHISMKLAMREPFHKTATQTCNAESNLSIQLIGPASVQD